MVKETMTAKDEQRGLGKAYEKVKAIHDGKSDAGKLRYDLIPVTFLEQMAAVMTHGANKYDENTWQTVPNGKRRYVGAAFRHLVAHCKGEANDSDSGLPHLAHLACNAMFLFELHRV